jgi:CRP-like cAMP-binding protein
MDFLSEKRQEIDARLKELRPLVDEFHKLEKAKAALDGLEGPRRGPGRPRGSGTTTRRRRRRRGGTRAEQALEIVRQNPGVTVRDLAEKLGIRQNYLYRVMGGLESDGAVKREGRGFVAK